jgi:nitrogen fixation protein FixH
MSVARENKVTGRHVLIGMLVFFGIVLVANGAFIFLALDSWTGLSTEDAYRKGVAYNETLDAAEAQKALGWRADLAFEAEDGGGLLQVAFEDARGDPVAGLTVTAAIRRPTHEGFDREVTLEPFDAGRYAARIELPLSGQWDVSLIARARDGARYEIEERIWLK